MVLDSQLPACMAHLRESLRGLTPADKKLRLNAFCRLGQKKEHLASEVLSRLQKMNAFSLLPPCRCDRSIVDLKLAEVLAGTLLWFRGDQAARAACKGIGVWKQARLRATVELVRLTSPKLASEMERWPDHYFGDCHSPRETGAERLGRDAFFQNWMVVELAAVVWYATDASPSKILSEALPPLLEAFAMCYKRNLPSRGLSNPEARIKRHLAHLDRTHEPPIHGSAFKNRSASISDLLLNRAVMLCFLDDRFPLTLLVRRLEERTSRNMGRGMVTNPAS